MPGSNASLCDRHRGGRHAPDVVVVPSVVTAEGDGIKISSPGRIRWSMPSVQPFAATSASSVIPSRSAMAKSESPATIVYVDVADSGSLVGDDGSVVGDDGSVAGSVVSATVARVAKVVTEVVVEELAEDASSSPPQAARRTSVASAGATKRVRVG